MAAALVEGVRHGVTTVCDFHRSGACLDLSLPEVAAAASSVGVRVATCYGASEADPPGERRLQPANPAASAPKSGAAGTAGCAPCSACSRRRSVAFDDMVADALDVAGGDLPVHVDLALDLTPAERWGDRAAPASRCRRRCGRTPRSRRAGCSAPPASAAIC